jgi:hypothetical protein
MTSTQSSGQILKTDSLLRVRTPPQRKRELLDEFGRSGLSGAKFAELAGIKYSTFAAWAAKRKRERPGDPTPVPPVDAAGKVRWLEAVVDRAQDSVGKGSCVLTLQFGGGARADIADARQAELAAAVLRAINKPSPSC